MDDVMTELDYPVSPKSISAHILLAEDDTVNQEVTIEMLESMGCKVDVVANGIELLEELNKVNYDVILMDCEMPEMDGIQTIMKIRRQNQSDKQIPVIATTANATTGYKEKCLAAGMDDFLSKPYSRERLKEILLRWL